MTYSSRNTAPAGELGKQAYAGDQNKVDVVDKIPDDERFEATWAFWVAFASLSLLGLVTSLSVSSLSTALTTIGHQLGLSQDQQFWIPTSGALTSTIFQPMCAILADLLGTNGALALSALAFILGSILAGTSHTFPAMLAGNCCRGIGVGGMITVTDIILTSIVPLRQRGKWLSLLNVAWAVGLSTGPFIGGFLATASRWRWLFLMNLFPTTIGIATALYIVPKVRKHLNKRPATKHVDLIGLTLLIASITAVLVPLMQVQVTYTWRDWQTLVPLILGLLGIVVFLNYECCLAANPIIPLTFFKNRSCLLAFFCATVHNITLWCLLFYLPLYYESVLGFSPKKAGVALFPETVTLTLAATVTGWLITRTGCYVWAIRLGWVVTTLGYGLMSLLNTKSSTAAWVLINFVPGIGAGLLLSSLTFAIQAPVSAEHTAIAVTLHTFFRSFGSALGIAVGSAVFRDRLNVEIRSNASLASMLGGKASANVVTMFQNLDNLDVTLRKALLISINNSLRSVWITIAALSGFAILISLGILPYKLSCYDAERLESFDCDEKRSRSPC